MQGSENVPANNLKPPTKPEFPPSLQKHLPRYLGTYMSWFREDPTDHSLFSSPLLRVTETESSPILQTITRSTLETLSYTQMWIAVWYSVWCSVVQ